MHTLFKKFEFHQKKIRQLFVFSCDVFPIFVLFPLGVVLTIETESSAPICQEFKIVAQICEWMCSAGCIPWCTSTPNLTTASSYATSGCISPCIPHVSSELELIKTNPGVLARCVAEDRKKYLPGLTYYCSEKEYSVNIQTLPNFFQ